MSPPEPSQEQLESADTYGRRVGCFINHLDRPLRFRDHLQFLKDGCGTTDARGLAPGHGLRDLSLPNPKIDIARFEAGGFPEQIFLSDDSHTPRSLPDPLEPWSPALRIRQLQLPLELPILNSNAADDFQSYLSTVNERQSCDIIDQWLPLSSVDDMNDEGLSFPQRSARFHRLLCREIDREQLVAAAKAADVLLPGEDCTDMQPSSTVETELPSFRKLLVDPITPPLSPVSEDNLVFVPDLSTCSIDLTSEASSPINPRLNRIQAGLLDDKIESDSTLLAFELNTTQSPSLPPALIQTNPCLQDLKLDVPAVADLSSSDAFVDHDIVARECDEAQVNAPPLDVNNEPFESFFDNAFAEALDGYQIKANEAVEQEQYDPNDSFSRVRVPVMDFAIPNIEWKGHVSCAKSHFSWLREQSTETFRLQAEPWKAALDSELRWIPVPQGKGHPRTREELAPLKPMSRPLLSADPCNDIDSSHYVRQSTSLAILQRVKTEDEELEFMEIRQDHAECSPFFQASGPPPDKALFRVSPRKSESPSLMELVRVKAKGQAAVDPALSLGNGILDTRRLLDDFMEMRAIKRPKLAQGTETMGHSIPSCASSVTVMEGATTKQEPAPAPKIHIPDDKANFVVSIDLARPILEYLESIWAPEHLIDRDFSAIHYTEHSIEDARQKSQPESTADADISLTPAVGVVVTSLSKARQRPLPGSECLPQLRERISRVSMKYETLFVLVSEMNLAGEVIGTVGASDLAAYADFVLFATGLEADVITILVPGAYETTARWIMALMCRHSPSSLETSRYVSGSESTWELFFRRAGMNVVAAQVLSSVLFEEAGNEGLARFLAMTIQERLARYSRLLGSDRLLLRACHVLDQPWH